MGQTKKQREGTILVNGSKMKRLREAKGWTRDGLLKAIRELSQKSPSKIIAIESVRTIENVETCHAAFPQTVFAIATALGVGVDDLRLDDPHHQFAAFIEERTREFVGRSFVFEAMESFFNDNQSGYFIVEGDPGAGKSALLAEFVRRSQCIHHFNSHALGVTSTTRFLQGICEQLISAHSLSHGGVPPDSVEDGLFLTRLLKEASDKLGKGERLVIAVDALDEVETSESAAKSNVLFLPPTLPVGVYFVVTSRRRAEKPLVAQAAVRVFDLTQHNEENKLDIAAFIRQHLDSGDFQDYLHEHSISEKKFTDALVAKSELNFMYLTHVIPLLQRNEAYHDRDLDKLPDGLQGYYDDHWKRMGMTAVPLPRVKLDVIYILSVVKRPTPRRLVAEALKVDAVAAQMVFDEWTAFLHIEHTESENCFSLYHSSFRDFLHRKDIVQAAGLELRGIKQKFAKYLLGRWKEA